MISWTKRQYPRKDKLGKRHFLPKVKVQTSPKKVWLSLMDDEEVHYDGIKKQEWSISKLQRLFQFKVTDI